MALPRRSTAERRAHKLLAQLAIGDPPIDVQQIARAVGASVSYQRMGSEISGMTYRDGQRIIIGLNSAHSLRRQRFTAAHEIGHITLHPGRPVTIDSNVRVNFRDGVSSQATDAEEIEANAFAAALLMPAQAVIAHARHHLELGGRRRDKLINDLAAAFDVSPEAMGYRLINLGVTSAP